MRARIVALGLLPVLAAGACGSRLPDETLQAIDAGSVGSAGGGSAATPSEPGGGSGVSASTDEGTGTAGGSGSGVASGGRPSSGSGDTGSSGGGATGAVDPGSKCKDAKSAAPGVTDTEIKVASIVTDSGPLPGATEGAYRGAAAYFAMVNAQGGVCGRKVTLVKGDDGLDPQKARGEFLRLEPNVLAFVGAYAVADSGYIDLIKKTNVPYVSLVIDPAGRDFPNVMPRVTSTHVNTGPFVWWKRENPNVSKAALLYASVGGVGANVPGFEAAMAQAGFDRRYTVAADVASPDYTAEVRQAQDEGIEFFYLFAFEVNMHVRMVRNMRQQNYDPPIKGSIIAFNTRFSDLLGAEGDGWQNHQTHLLFLDPQERNRSAALARFADWNARVFPGGQLDLFPVSGWGRAALFVEALQQIEGEISRKTLLDALHGLKAFDGGGMEAPLDPQTGLGEPCFNIAAHEGGKWVRKYPADELYECGLGEMYKYVQ